MVKEKIFPSNLINTAYEFITPQQRRFRRIDNDRRDLYKYIYDMATFGYETLMNCGLSTANNLGKVRQDIYTNAYTILDNTRVSGAYIIGDEVDFPISEMQVYYKKYDNVGQTYYPKSNIRWIAESFSNTLFITPRVVSNYYRVIPASYDRNNKPSRYGYYIYSPHFGAYLNNKPYFNPLFARLIVREIADQLGEDFVDFFSKEEVGKVDITKITLLNSIMPTAESNAKSLLNGVKEIYMEGPYLTGVASYFDNHYKPLVFNNKY